MSWISQEIAAFGGDSDRIVVIGQSAGASHVASYATLPNVLGDRAGLCGIVTLSGIYDFPTFGSTEWVLAYLGSWARASAASSLRALAEMDLPHLVVCAEFDPAEFHEQAKVLFDARYAATKRIRDFLFLAGHNHVSEVVALGARGFKCSPLEIGLLEFVRRVTSSGGPSTASDLTID
jgi:triacylglycerol lipase